MSDLNPIKVREAEESLHRLLGPQLAEAIDLIHAKDESLVIEMPEAFDIDLTIENLMHKVARASNVYSRHARIAGMAEAEFKIAKGRFDRKYKVCKDGKNTAEREANAMQLCELEHIAMVTAEAVAVITDRLESQARIASESARKLLDKAQAMQIGQSRESHGMYRDSDFSPY